MTEVLVEEREADRFEAKRLRAVEMRPFGPDVFVVLPIDGSIPIDDEVIRVVINRFDLIDPEVEIHPDPNLIAPFDIDASLVNRPQGTATKVEVILRDNRFQFVTNEYCMTAGDMRSRPVLRRGLNPARDRIEFYVVRDSRVPRVSFNFGMIVAATGFFFHVDPKIENNG